MRNYVERAKDFVKEIFPFIGEWNDPYYVIDDVNEFNERHHRNVIMRHGIARIALITSDYVVKYDFDAEEVEQVGGGENEIELYAQAERDGFAYLFAKVTPFDYNGHRFYIMPRIRGINGDSWNHADYYMTEEENAWCDKHHLSDLHCNNYGFRNGKVCIVDYACRLDETSSEYDSNESSSWS